VIPGWWLAARGLAGDVRDQAAIRRGILCKTGGVKVCVVFWEEGCEGSGYSIPKTRP
jgi:hypothetical protein